VIIEDSEANCLASATTIQVARPDLVETAVSNPPAFAKPGDVVAVTDTTKNQGGLVAKRPRRGITSLDI
jgi:hypothetical protein